MERMDTEWDRLMEADTMDEYLSETFDDVLGRSEAEILAATQSIREELYEQRDTFAELDGGLAEVEYGQFRPSEPSDAAEYAITETAVLQEEDIERFVASLNDAALGLADAVTSVEVTTEIHEPEDRERYQAAMSQAVMSVSAMQTSTNRFHTKLSTAQQFDVVPSARTAVSSLSRWVRNTLKPLLQQVSGALWNLLQNKATLQDWSVSGELGTNLIGLQGKIGIQLNFT